MFGYIRTAMPELKVKELTRYKAYYCGVCKAMGEFTFLGRGLLSFDMAFYALLIDSVAEAEITRRVCVPKLKKVPCAQGEAVRYAAALNILLSVGKLQDDIQDGEAYKKVLAAVLKGANRRAGAQASGAAEEINKRLAALLELERRGCDRIDEVADAFATLCAELCASAPGVSQEETLRRIVWNVGYHAGRWVYLIDAFDDLGEDEKKGNYNPIALEMKRRGIGREEIAPWVKETLFASLHDAALAVNLLPESFNKPILHNIVAYGLHDKTIEIIKKREQEYGSL